MLEFRNYANEELAEYYAIPNDANIKRNLKKKLAKDGYKYSESRGYFTIKGYEEPKSKKPKKDVSKLSHETRAKKLRQLTGHSFTAEFAYYLHSLLTIDSIQSEPHNLKANRIYEKLGWKSESLINAEKLWERYENGEIKLPSEEFKAKDYTELFFELKKKDKHKHDTFSRYNTALIKSGLFERKYEQENYYKTYFVDDTKKIEPASQLEYVEYSNATVEFKKKIASGQVEVDIPSDKCLQFIYSEKTPEERKKHFLDDEAKRLAAQEKKQFVYIVQSILPTKNLTKEIKEELIGLLTPEVEKSEKEWQTQKDKEIISIEEVKPVINVKPVQNEISEENQKKIDEVEASFGKVEEKPVYESWEEMMLKKYNIDFNAIDNSELLSVEL